MFDNKREQTTIEEFQSYVKQHIREYLPEEFSSAECFAQSIDKPNGAVWNGIVVKNSNETASPIIYLDNYYDSFIRDTLDLHQAMTSIAAAILASKQRIPDILDCVKIGSVHDWEQIKSAIVGRVVNTDRNERMLSDMPHFDKLDLSMIFEICLSQGDSAPQPSLASIRVTTELMKMWGVNETILYDYAMKNMNRINPYQVIDMGTMIQGLMGDSEEMDFNVALMLPDEGMYVITNTTRVNGASVMFTEESFVQLADRIGDLYIMPSSVHEVITVSAKGFDPSFLAEMVREINATAVSREEQLSDHIYLYSKNRHSIEIVGDLTGLENKISNTESKDANSARKRGGR